MASDSGMDMAAGPLGCLAVLALLAAFALGLLGGNCGGLRERIRAQIHEANR